jgi:hypothetical protein
MRTHRKSFPALLLGLALSAGTATANTIAYWNFDEGTAGQVFFANPANDLSDNGNTMYGADLNFSPAYSLVGQTPSGKGLSLDTMTGGRDGFTTHPTLNGWKPLRWTIEASVQLDKPNGVITVIGRDGSSFGKPLSDFYLQKNEGSKSWRVDFSTAGGQRVTIDAKILPTVKTWYQLAVTSDGSIVRFYVNDLSGNEGYREVGTAALTGATPADNALAASGANWTFGRGWHGGKLVDHLQGRLDEIRFSDTALKVEEFLKAR